MVEGEKMSKSLGNLYTLDDLTAKGYTPNQIRFALIAGHYRQQLNFTFKGLDDAKSAISKLGKLTAATLEKLSVSKEEFESYIHSNVNFVGTAFEPAWNAMCDDLNVPKALGEIFTGFSKGKEAPLTKADMKALGGMLYALGISVFEEDAKTDVPEEIESIARRRAEAKANKDYGLADSLRNEASQTGWLIVDTKDGFEIKKA
jgi:cysteinyl-tRNA synthetase